MSDTKSSRSAWRCLICRGAEQSQTSRKRVAARRAVQVALVPAKVSFCCCCWCQAMDAQDSCACRVCTDDQVRLAALPEERLSHISGFGHCCVQGILVWVELGLVKVLCKGAACGQVLMRKCMNSSEEWDVRPVLTLDEQLVAGRSASKALYVVGTPRPEPISCLPAWRHTPGSSRAGS